MKRNSLVFALLGCLIGARLCFGLAEERVGPQPKVHPQPGWPAGIVNLLQHESRVYSIWVNGNENFYFNASAEQLDELIQAFSKTRLRDHEVRVVAEKPTAGTFKGDVIGYNVNLHVLEGIALFVTQRNEEPKTHEPVLTIHVDPKADRDLFTKIKFPDNIVLKNEVRELPLMGRSKLPDRKTWHALIQFDDGSPATDFEGGVSTVITLWEKGVKEGIRLGKADRNGLFHAAFSEQELADLRDGRLWITLTAGNYLTQPRSDHPRLDVDKLALDKTKLDPVKLDQPGYYYGRILFEDGSPPILDPEPWTGAEIGVNFSFAGQANPDAEGYFKVYFTAEQFEQLKTKKARKNIYVPSYENKNRSTALHTFPAVRLSLKKEKAGVVKIPNPAPPDSAPRQEQ